MRRSILVLILGFVSGSAALAQVMEVSLEKRTDEAIAIVEARVVESTPFWNPDRTNILTKHRLRVFKVLKIDARRLDSMELIELITPGGEIDNVGQQVTPSLSLSAGDTGVFFLEQRESYRGLHDVWLPVAGPQGFVRYDRLSGETRDPFRVYPDAQEDLFEPIRSRSGQPAAVIVAENPRPEPPQMLGGPMITGFSPSTVNGGVGEILTIDGSGFGSFTGSATIFFDDPDDGPGGDFASFSSTDHVVSWMDTEIQVKVPDSAGSGFVTVRDAAGLMGTSVSPLNVEYSLSEKILLSGLVGRVFHENEDNRGGLTFKFSTGTANNGVDFTSNQDAVDRFLEALEDWRCATGWTAEVDGTAAVASALTDDINIVSFDNDADPLPSGVLGRATTAYTRCSGGGLPEGAHVEEVDLRFRRDGVGVNWFFGADTASQMPGEQDFMTVATHEIGHGVQHRHVNDPSDLMYWSIFPGTNNRTLNAANIAGGQDILAYSDGQLIACALGMRTFDCLAAPTARFSTDPPAACGTSLSVDFTDLSYDGPTSWDWSFGDTASSTERNPSHLYGSQGVYPVSMDVANLNGSDSAGSLVVLTDAPASTCAPTFASGYNPNTGIGPRLVTLNTMSSFSQTVVEGDPMYDDYSCSRMTALEPGMSYPLSVVTGGGNLQAAQAYIDWNNDGTLDAGELVLDSPIPAVTHNGTVNVPMTAVTDTGLRMRVLVDFNPITSACQELDFGQVEDYSVVVAAPAAVPGVVPNTSLRVDRSPFTEGNVLLSWGETCGPGGADYSIYQGNLGDFDSHTMRICSTGGAMVREVNPGPAERYYLVVPFSATAEGSYGRATSGERPRGVMTCTVDQDAGACP